MIRAHRIRLNPTPEQREYFVKAAGTRRFVYNWGLEEWQRQYTAGEKPTANKIKQQFNAIKGEQYPWVYEVTKCAVEGAFIDLGTAFNNFFKKRAKYPRFKSKRRSRDGFYVSNDKVTVGGHRVKLPHIGWVNMAENLRLEGKILSARITRSADWWYVSLVVELPDPKPVPHPGGAVGIDLGINRLATLSDGSELENQKPLRTHLRQINRLQRALSRKQPGSANWHKARRKLARLYYKVACIRDDILHKFTTQLVNDYAFIVIEDLNVKGMMQNRRLALSLSDAAFGRFEELLKQKAATSGTVVVQVDPFFPSTRRCHQCGHERDMPLSERTYYCLNPECQAVFDRDYNASMNLLHEGQRLAGAV